MPRAEQMPAAKVLEFFETSPLDTAVLVMGLAAEKVKVRKTRSTEAKARGVALSRKQKKAKGAPSAGNTVDQEAGETVTA